MSRTILDEIQKKLNIYLDTAEGLPELIKLLNHFLLIQIYKNYIGLN